MAGPAQGHKAFCQFIKESSTYGTWTAPDKALEVISIDAQPVLATIPDPSLNNRPSLRALFQGGFLYRVKVSLRMNYEGLASVFEGCFGSAASSSAIETGVYAHTFKEASLMPAYSFELQEGDPVGDTTITRYLGCKFTSMMIKGTAGTGADAFLHLDVEFIAKSVTVDQAVTGSLTAASVYPIMYHHAITIDNGLSAAGTIRVRSFEVSLTNPLAEDRFYLGALNIDEPVRNDFLSVRWKFTEEFQSRALLTAATAFTVASPQLVFRGPALIGATKYHEFELRSNKAQWSAYSNPVSGYGIVTAQHEAQAFYDTGDATALLGRLQNNAASYTA
jgi:hypothetical protein